jgi:hypothetical protein
VDSACLCAVWWDNFECGQLIRLTGIVLQRN